MKCPQCQHENSVGQKFCGECGAGLATGCAACGAANPPGQKFCGECGAPLSEARATPKFASPDAYTPKHLADKILTSRGSLEGERKQVTVLFADIKGSLELIEGSDPEQAQTLLDSTIHAMMEAVHRYEGTVNKVMGDGIMALFGAPLAHEDHAVRACYAALAMQQAIRRTAEDSRRRHGVEVQVRVGLNSGEVVVRAIGNDLTMDYDAIGQTTHLAGRMEQLAVPGTVRLTGDTLRLAEGFVEVNPLGPIPVKGLAEPVEVFELTRATATRTRFQAAVARGLTRFVGRQTELEALNRALARAGEGQGQLFAVVGEPGVGKSRLFYEFTRSRRTENWLILESGSVSYGKAVPWLPVIDLLKAYFEIEDRDDARRIREKVTGKLLTLDEGLKPMLAAILALLDVPAEDAAWEALDPPQRRRRTLEAVKGLLFRESQVQPLVAVFEDLHWIDTETQAFLDALVEGLPSARILLLVNYRPEYRDAWGGKTYYALRRIDPLPPESAEELLATLLGAEPGLAPIRKTLIERTEGNPFFLEETVRTLVETGALAGEPGAYRVAGDVAAIRIPATVQGVLAARIDRLPADGKRLLQMAAAIGKDVPYTLLSAIADVSEDDLGRGLAKLQATEFLYETRLFPDREYTFKHALTHEVAYGSLLRERRRALHRKIAEAIESAYAARLAEQLERLAHHYTEAGLAEKAVDYWLQAGKRAIERSANAEAIGQLTKGLELLGTLPDTPERDLKELMLQIAMGVPLQDTKGPGSPEAGRAYSRARELCCGEGTVVSDHFVVVWGLWRFYRQGAEFEEARERAAELLDLAQRQQDPALLIQAHHAQWTTRFLIGEFASAREHAEQGVALYSPDDHHAQAFLFGGHDPCVCGHTIAAESLWALGYPDQAMMRTNEALALARDLDHPSSLALALGECAKMHHWRGEEPEAGKQAEALIALAAEQEFAHKLSTGSYLQGWALTLQGRDEEGLGEMREALVQAGARAEIEEPYFVSLLALAYARLGRIDEGLSALGKAFALTDGSGMRYWEAELYRLKGELLLASPDGRRPEAESCFHKAIEVAQGQSARSLELRAATSLARLWRGQGKPSQARDVLEPVYDWFTEGFDTPDLKEAKALLDDLA